MASKTLADFFGAADAPASPAQREHEWVRRAAERDSAAVSCAVDWLVRLDHAAFSVALAGATMARPARNAESYAPEGGDAADAAVDGAASSPAAPAMSPGLVARAIMAQADPDRRVQLASAALRYCKDSPAEAANKLRVFFLTFPGAHFFADALSTAGDVAPVLAVIEQMLTIDNTGVPQTDWLIASTKLRDALISVGRGFASDARKLSADAQRALAQLLSILTTMLHACSTVPILPIRAMDYGRANDGLSVPADALLLPEGWLCCGLPAMLFAIDAYPGDAPFAAMRRTFRAMCRLNHVSWHASLANKVRSVAGAGATTFGQSAGGGAATDWATLSEALAAVYLRLCAITRGPLTKSHERHSPTEHGLVNRFRVAPKDRAAMRMFPDIDTDMATDLAFMIVGERLSYDPEPQAQRRYRDVDGPTDAERLVQLKAVHFGAHGNAEKTPRATSNTPNFGEGPGISTRAKASPWPFLSGELQELFSKSVAEHTARLVEALFLTMDGSPDKHRRFLAATGLDLVISVLRTLEEAQLLHIIIATELHLLPSNVFGISGWREWAAAVSYAELEPSQREVLDESDVLFAQGRTPMPLVVKSMLLARDMYRFEQRQRGTNALNASERETLEAASPHMLAPLVHGVLRDPIPWLFTEANFAPAVAGALLSFCLPRAAARNADAYDGANDMHSALSSLVVEAGPRHRQVLREVLACAEHREMMWRAKLLGNLFISLLMSLKHAKAVVDAAAAAAAGGTSDDAAPTSPLSNKPPTASEEATALDERCALAAALVLRSERPRHAPFVEFMAPSEMCEILLTTIEKTSHPELLRALGFLMGRARTVGSLASEYALNPRAIAVFADGFGAVLRNEAWTAAKSLMHCGAEIRHFLAPERGTELQRMLAALQAHPKESATDASAVLKCYMCLAERNAVPSWADTPDDPLHGFPTTPTPLLLAVGELATQLVNKCADDNRRFSDALAGVLRLGTLVLHNDLIDRVELSLPRITRETAKQFLFWPQKHECTVPAVVEEACLFAVTALGHDTVDLATVASFLDDYAIPHVESTRGNVRPVCVCFLALRDRLKENGGKDADGTRVKLPNIERLLSLPPSIDYSDVVSAAATPVCLLMRGMLHLHAGLACRAHAAVAPQLGVESVHALPDGVWESALTPAVAEAFYSKIAHMLHATMYVTTEDDPTSAWRVPLLLLNRIACVMRQDHGPFYCTARFRNVLIQLARYAEHSPTLAHAFVGLMARFISCAPSIAVFLAIPQLQGPVERLHRLRVADVPKAVLQWSTDWALPFRMLPNRDETAHDAAGAATAMTIEERESVVAGGHTFGKSDAWPDAEPFHYEPRPVAPRAAIGLAAIPQALVLRDPQAARLSRIARLLCRNEKDSPLTAPPAQRMANRISRWAPDTQMYSVKAPGVAFVRRPDPVPSRYS